MMSCPGFDVTKQIFQIKSVTFKVPDKNAGCERYKNLTH